MQAALQGAMQGHPPASHRAFMLALLQPNSIVGHDGPTDPAVIATPSSRDSLLGNGILAWGADQHLLKIDRASPPIQSEASVTCGPRPGSFHGDNGRGHVRGYPTADAMKHRPGQLLRRPNVAGYAGAAWLLAAAGAAVSCAVVNGADSVRRTLRVPSCSEEAHTSHPPKICQARKIFHPSSGRGTTGGPLHARIAGVPAELQALQLRFQGIAGYTACNDGLAGNTPLKSLALQAGRDFPVRTVEDCESDNLRNHAEPSKSGRKTRGTQKYTKKTVDEKIQKMAKNGIRDN